MAQDKRTKTCAMVDCHFNGMSTLNRSAMHLVTSKQQYLQDRPILGSSMPIVNWHAQTYTIQQWLIWARRVAAYKANNVCKVQLCATRLCASGSEQLDVPHSSRVRQSDSVLGNLQELIQMAIIVQECGLTLLALALGVDIVHKLGAVLQKLHEQGGCCCTLGSTALRLPSGWQQSSPVLRVQWFLHSKPSSHLAPACMVPLLYCALGRHGGLLQERQGCVCMRCCYCPFPSDVFAVKLAPLDPPEPARHAHLPQQTTALTT